MREVTKAEFKRIYFSCGGGRDGWDAAYWKRFFEDEVRPSMKFMTEDPETPQHTKMFIVADFGAHEYRVFFKTEAETDDFMEFPGDDS